MNQSFQDYQYKSENNLRKELWKLLDKMNSSSENNIDISINELYEYFKILNSDNEISDTDSELPDCEDEFVDEIVNGKITENEVLLAAKYMKNGKAPGYDMVVNEYIKSTINLFLPLYVELFN